MGNSQSEGFSENSTTSDVASQFGTRAQGKAVIVTGANSGLGMETARVLASYGADVTMACRNLKAGEEALAKIRKDLPDARIQLRQLDLGSFKSIRAFAKGYKEEGKPLHLLINNAGIMACPLSFTTDGLESQFGVNHVGHFLLTTELLPVLKRSGTTQDPARVVNLASTAQRWFAPDVGIQFDDLRAEQGYNLWHRYGSSKLANVLFSNELNRRMQEEHAPVISVAVHPGVIMETGLVRHGTSVNYFLEIVLSARDWESVYSFATSKLKSIPQGAATSVFCALAPEVVPGGYYADCQLNDYLHPKAYDAELAKELWEVSEKLVTAGDSFYPQEPDPSM